MRKLLHLSSAAMLALCFFAVSVFAETSAYKDYGTVYEEAEFQAVLEAVEHDPFIQNADVLNAGQNDGAAEQSMNPYKLYTMSAIDFKTFTGDETDITKGDSDNYLWILPAANGNVIRVQSVEDRWQVIGYSTPSETVRETDVINFDLLPETTGDSLLCFEIPEYHTSFVYCVTAEGVRLIPYGSRPDLTGLANGKAYAIGEVQKILGDAFNVTPAPEMLASESAADGGGAVLTSESSNSIPWIAAAGILGIIILACMSVVLYRRQRSR